MNCQCVDTHPLVMFGVFLGDNCQGITGWGIVAMFGGILLAGSIILPILLWLENRFW